MAELGERAKEGVHQLPTPGYDPSRAGRRVRRAVSIVRDHPASLPKAAWRGLQALPQGEVEVLEVLLREESER